MHKVQSNKIIRTWEILGWKCRTSYIQKYRVQFSNGFPGPISTKNKPSTTSISITVNSFHFGTMPVILDLIWFNFSIFRITFIVSVQIQCIFIDTNHAIFVSGMDLRCYTLRKITYWRPKVAWVDGKNCVTLIASPCQGDWPLICLRLVAVPMRTSINCVFWAIFSTNKRTFLKLLTNGHPEQTCNRFQDRAGLPV